MSIESKYSTFETEPLNETIIGIKMPFLKIVLVIFFTILRCLRQFTYEEKIDLVHSSGSFSPRFHNSFLYFIIFLSIFLSSFCYFISSFVLIIGESEVNIREKIMTKQFMLCTKN